MDWDPIIAIVSIIFGIIIIVSEPILRYVVGLFFILLGVWFILQWIQKRRPTEPQQSPPNPPPEKPNS